MKYGSGRTRPRRWGERGTLSARVHLGAFVAAAVQVDGRVEAGEYHEASDGRDLEQINIKHRTLLHLHPFL